MNNNFYQLDDIGYIGTQDVLLKEESERADAAVHSYIQSQKAAETLEEREYYSAFGTLLQALDKFKAAKNRFNLSVA